MSEALHAAILRVPIFQKKVVKRPRKWNIDVSPEMHVSDLCLPKQKLAPAKSMRRHNNLRPTHHFLFQRFRPRSHHSHLPVLSHSMGATAQSIPKAQPSLIRGL